MTPTLCILGGCNGAGKTTLARELLPRLGLMRFLNADEIARGLSPLDPTLCAFKAGRLLLEEAPDRSSLPRPASPSSRKPWEGWGQTDRRSARRAADWDVRRQSTLSGKTYVALIRAAKARGYRFLLHYIVIGSGAQAVGRVALRVKLGGHHVPEDDVLRRFDRSRRHFSADYLPLADEWVLWDNQSPPHRRIADSSTHTLAELKAMLTSNTLQEAPPRDMSEMVRIGLEASRVATEKMLDYYKRMGIKVTPEMTLALEKPKRTRRK